jgi:ABC-type Na+ efflux pump permease subunit
MTILPIFIRDLRSERRRWRWRRDRLVGGLAGGILLMILASVDRWVEGANVSRFLKALPLTLIAPYLLLMIGLSLGAQLLSTERREGTLPLLLLTRLSGYDIVVGKLLLAFVLEINTLLAAAPGLVLPLLMAGFKGREICFLAIGCANAIFFGLALGLLLAVFMNEQGAVAGSLLFLFPCLLSATPLPLLLPIGPLRDLVTALQVFNPGEALAHLQSVLGGFRSSAFWTPLVVSHLAGWALLLAGASCLPSACRRAAGRNAGPGATQGGKFWRPLNRSLAFRTRHLNRNPILWLSLRARWPTVQTWLYLALSGLLWGWLAWLCVVRGTNVLFVLVIAVGLSWMLQFLVMVPAEASRRFVEDKQSGMLEVLLCTPVSRRRFLAGQWLALGHRFLPPLVLAILLSAGLMLAGYLTDGFGGMLDSEDRGLWLFGWLGMMGCLPLALTALAWVAMRRSFTARNVGDATAVALLQVIGLPCLVLGVIPMLLHSLWRWEPAWGWRGALSVVGFAAAQIGFAWRARAVLMRARPG